MDRLCMLLWLLVLGNKSRIGNLWPLENARRWASGVRIIERGVGADAKGGRDRSRGISGQAGKIGAGTGNENRSAFGGRRATIQRFSLPALHTVHCIATGLITSLSLLDIL